MKYAKDKGLVESNRVKIMEFAEWETKPPKTYEKRWFWIHTGTRTKSPEIITNKRKLHRYKKELDEIKSVKNVDNDRLFEIIKVPQAGGEYVRSAELNLPDFIRDVCGRPTEALTMFFGQKEPIFKAIRVASLDPEDNLLSQHPFTDEVTNFYDGVSLIEDRLVKKIKKKDGEFLTQPIKNPHATRYIHVDTGLTKDAAGFAMGHISGWTDIQRMIDGGKVVKEVAPLIWFDVVLRIIPPPGGEIPFASIRSLIYTLSDFGFNIGFVSLDSWQSRDFIQQVRDKGYEAEVVSIDKTTTPYDYLKSAFLEERLSMYSYPIVEKELCQLERIKTGKILKGRPVEKINHPKSGSKDVSDAMAGVVDAIETRGMNDIHDPLPVKDIDVPKSNAQLEVEAREAFDKGDFEKLYEMLGEDE